MNKNLVILTLGRVHRSPTSPWVRQFTISIRNNVDTVDTHMNNNSENIKNYKETHELEEILAGIREHVQNSDLPRIYDLIVEIDS